MATMMQDAHTEQGAVAQKWEGIRAKCKGGEIVVEQHEAVWSLIEHPCGCTEERCTRYSGMGRYTAMMSELHPCDNHFGGSWK